MVAFGAGGVGMKGIRALAPWVMQGLGEKHQEAGFPGRLNLLALPRLELDQTNSVLLKLLGLWYICCKSSDDG